MQAAERKIVRNILAVFGRNFRESLMCNAARRLACRLSSRLRVCCGEKKKKKTSQVGKKKRFEKTFFRIFFSFAPVPTFAEDARGEKSEVRPARELGSGILNVHEDQLHEHLRYLILSMLS